MKGNSFQKKKTYSSPIHLKQYYVCNWSSFHFFKKNDRLQTCSSVRGLGKIWILIFLFQNWSSSVLAEILERWSEIRFYLSCNYIWAQTFMVKTQLIKFKNFYTPLCLNLHPVTKKTKNSKQNAEGCKDWGIYQNFWSILWQVYLFSLFQPSRKTARGFKI